MADSKTSHWKSLAADLSGTAPEADIRKDAVADSDESASDQRANDIFEGTMEAREVEDVTTSEDTSERNQTEVSPASDGPPQKKKKRGSWAFWRSGNKKKKGAEGNRAGSDDPLTLLNQAETTDDMACAIDQLFSNNGSDAHDDEVLFDADDIATSIDFEDEARPASRDVDTNRSQDDRRTQNRGGGRSSRRRDGDDGRQREGRSRDNSGRSRNERENSQPRDERRSSNREDSRSRRSDKRDRDTDSGKSDRRQGRRRKEKTVRPAIDHGDVPTWDTAVSFVVDNNMTTRDSRSGGKKKTRSRSKKKARS